MHVKKSLPLAVQQKHIIVTCNYEARRRVREHFPVDKFCFGCADWPTLQGLYKLQLITGMLVPRRGFGSVYCD